MSPRAQRRDGALIRAVTLERDEIPDADAYPFSIPAIQQLDVLALDTPVTLFSGENGSGRSTLVDAIAIAAGFDPEGRQPEHDGLDAAVALRAASVSADGPPPAPAAHGLLPAAERFFNVATYVEELRDPTVTMVHGGVPLHERSHGESFIALVTHRFGPDGLY